MADNAWHYVQSGERRGPVELSQLQPLLTTGELPQDALVWTQALGDWKRACDVAALQTQPITTAAVAQEVSYFNATAGLPARAAETLRGHAAPRGETGVWPLDDLHCAQLGETLKLRKKITSAANLFRTLCGLSIIGCIAFGITAVVSLAGGRGNQMAVGMGMSGVFVLSLGFSVLYWLADRATRKSQRWASLAMLIIFSIIGVVDIGSMALIGTSNSRNAAAGIIGPFFSLLFMVGFAYVAGRAYVALPKYLAQPAWCQEILAMLKL